MPEQDVIELTGLGADGKEVKFNVPRATLFDAVKDTHIPTERFEADLNRRVTGIVKNKGLRSVDEFVDGADETLVQRFAEKHGLAKGGTPAKGDDERAREMREAVQRAVADVESKRIKPLEDKLKTAGETLDGLRLKGLENAILQAATEAGVKKVFLKGVTKGRPAAIVALLQDSFAMDEETGDFFASDGKDGFVLSQSSDKDTTYMGIAEYVATWAADPQNAEYLDKSGQAGAGTTGAAGKGAKGRRNDGNVYLTKEQGGNAQEFQKALDSVGGDYSRVIVEGRHKDAAGQQVI